MKLPAEFVKKNLEKAKGATFLGHPIEKLSRDELIACVVACHETKRKQSQRHVKDLNTLIPK